MPEIIIDNLNNKKIKSDQGGQVLKIIQENYIDWMHACGGKGRCTTCKMIVVEGMQNLSPLSPFEKKCKDNKLLQNDERLACQCVARDDIRIRVPHTSKLPHIEYSD